MKKLTMTANSIVFPYIGTGICTCEYILQQYLVLEVSVKSGIGAAPQTSYTAFRFLYTAPAVNIADGCDLIMKHILNFPIKYSIKAVIT